MRRRLRLAVLGSRRLINDSGRVCFVRLSHRFRCFSVLHGAAEKRAALCVPFWRGTVINLEPEKMTASGSAALRNLMLALNVLTGSLVVWT